MVGQARGGVSSEYGALGRTSGSASTALGARSGQIALLTARARPSRSRPGSGILAFEVTMTKQDGTVVQQGVDHLLVGGRPEGEA